MDLSVVYIIILLVVLLVVRYLTIRSEVSLGSGDNVDYGEAMGVIYDSEQDGIDKRLQGSEDRRHFITYANHRFLSDRSRIVGDWYKTKGAIRDFPDLRECVTEDSLKDIAKKYNKYVKMCDELKEFKLSKEEFLIKETNPALCVDFSSMYSSVIYNAHQYHIYDEKTAKYAKGDMYDIMKKEFKEKYY